MVIISPIKNFIKKYFFFLFYISTVIFYLIIKVQLAKSFDVYSIVIFGTFIVMFLFFKRSPIDFFGLSLDKLRGKLFLCVLPFILVNNFFLYFFDKILLGEDFTIRSITLLLILKYLFSTEHIRTCGEELIFRGFLLARTINKDSKTFWIANFSQALVFTSIHALIPNPTIPRIVFTIYVFCLSLLLGVLNRKFNSLFPSWMLHSTAGILINVILTST